METTRLKSKLSPPRVAKWALLAGAVLGLAMVSPAKAEGDYDTVNVQSVLSTAYGDTLQIAQRNDGSENKAKSKKSDSKDSKDSSSDSDSDSKNKSTGTGDGKFNTKEILDKGKSVVPPLTPSSNNPVRDNVNKAKKYGGSMFPFLDFLTGEEENALSDQELETLKKARVVKSEDPAPVISNDALNKAVADDIINNNSVSKLIESKKNENASKNDNVNDGNDKKGTSAASKGGEESTVTEEQLRQRVKRIVDTSNFGTVGIFIGGMESPFQKTISNYNNKNGLAPNHVKQWDELMGGKATQYTVFGTAVHDLMSTAKKRNLNTIKTEEVLERFNQLGVQFVGAGARLIRKYNPAPVIMAFMDSSQLIDGANEENELIKAINSNETASGFVRFFGDSSGVAGASYGLLFMGILALVATLLASVTMLFNGRRFGITLRRNLIRLLVATAGLQLAANLMNAGINWIDDTTESKQEAVVTNIVERNLHIAKWYETGFKIPDGVSIEVKNGKFRFSREIIGAINRNNFQTINGWTDDEEIGAAISLAAGKGNTYKAEFIAATRKDGNSWKTGKMYDIADFIAAADDEDNELNLDPNAVGYISHVSSTASGNAKSMTYSSGQTASRFGISPIAAYNLVNSSFELDSVNFNNNVANPTIPTVALMVDKPNAGKTSLKGLDNSFLRFIVTLTMMITGLKGLITIFAAGFGGIIRGGTKSTFGSALGFGELIGGVAALIMGVAGIGVLMGMSLIFLDTAWDIFESLIVGSGDEDGLLSEFTEGLRNVDGLFGIITNLIADAIAQLGKFVLFVISLFIAPRLVKIPIDVFAQWCSTLPPILGAKFAQYANIFVNDQSVGGGAAGAGSGASGVAGSIGGKIGSAMGGATKDAAKTMAGAGLLGIGAIGGAYSAMKNGENAKAGDSISNTENNTDENTTDNSKALTDSEVLQNASTEQEQLTESISQQESNEAIQNQSDNVTQSQEYVEQGGVGQPVAEGDQSISGEAGDPVETPVTGDQPVAEGEPAISDTPPVETPAETLTPTAEGGEGVGDPGKEPMAPSPVADAKAESITPAPADGGKDAPVVNTESSSISESGNTETSSVETNGGKDITSTETKTSEQASTEKSTEAVKAAGSGLTYKGSITNGTGQTKGESGGKGLSGETGGKTASPEGSKTPSPTGDTSGKSLTNAGGETATGSTGTAGTAREAVTGKASGLSGKISAGLTRAASAGKSAGRSLANGASSVKSAASSAKSTAQSVSDRMGQTHKDRMSKGARMMASGIAGSTMSGIAGDRAGNSIANAFMGNVNQTVNESQVTNNNHDDRDRDKGRGKGQGKGTVQNAAANNGQSPVNPAVRANPIPRENLGPNPRNLSASQGQINRAKGNNQTPVKRAVKPTAKPQIKSQVADKSRLKDVPLGRPKPLKDPK